MRSCPYRAPEMQTVALWARQLMPTPGRQLPADPVGTRGGGLLPSPSDLIALCLGHSLGQVRGAYRGSWWGEPLRELAGVTSQSSHIPDISAFLSDTYKGQEPPAHGARVGSGTFGHIPPRTQGQQCAQRGFCYPPDGESCKRAFVSSLMLGVLAASLTALRSHWGGAEMGRVGPRRAARAQGMGTPRKANTPSGLAEKQQQKHPWAGPPPPSPPQGPKGATVPTAAPNSLCPPLLTQLPRPPTLAGFVQHHIKCS